MNSDHPKRGPADTDPDGHPLSQADFDYVYSRVPRLAVEILVRDTRGRVYLTRRSVPPCAGQWTMPGGTVRFGETLRDAVQRVARRELGIDVVSADAHGCIEYPSHYLHGLDSPVGVVFVVNSYTGDPRVGADASDGQWFTHAPFGMHADQDEYLLDNHYLTR